MLEIAVVLLVVVWLFSPDCIVVVVVVVVRASTHVCSNARTLQEAILTESVCVWGGDVYSIKQGVERVCVDRQNYERCHGIILNPN